MEYNSLLAQKSNLPNMINPHRWLKHFPNQLRTSWIRKAWVIEKHSNPGIWRENNYGLATVNTILAYRWEKGANSQ